VTDISQFSALRGLSISAEYRHPGIEASGGLVRYGFDSTDIISEKCDDSYRRLDIGSFGIVQLYAEYPGPFKPTNYSSAFARISPVTAVTGTGIYGIARSTYGTMKVSAFSYIGGSQAEVCTRPEDKTDFVCHAISGYTAGTCDDTTLVGVKLGFEFGCANAPADWIDRRFIQYNGSEWTSQPLNPVKGLPSIGSSRFGFPRYVASGSKLGVAYEYELTSGTIQTQLTNGNSIVGTYTIGTDIPPQGFNPSLATRMAGDCTRAGVCAFGRYQAASKSNFVDLIDFRESPPEINTWRLGSSPSGFDFGRAVNINGRDGTALYASYTTSPTPDQNRLQLDYIDLKKYQKFTLAFDYAAGAGKYPLSLSREGGDWGLGHARGVDLIYSLTEGCKPARIGGHSTGNDSGTSHPAFPCENVIPIHSRF
jgi:hypothetical protein